MANWKNQLEKKSSVRPNRVLTGWLSVAAACVFLGACGGSTPTSPTSSTASSSPSSTSAPPAATSPSPAAAIAGNYTLAIRNAPTCPTSARDYPVTITQSGSSIAINGPNTSDYQTTVVITSFAGGTVTGSRFSVYVAASEIAGINSTSPGAILLYAIGEMAGTISGGAISGTLNGEFGRPTGFSACSAVNHAFTLRRR